MCLTKECTDQYLDKLEHNIKEYMAIPISQRSAEAVDNMVACWERIKALSDKLTDTETFSRDDAEAWNASMVNSDGTRGGHWSISATNPLKPSDVKDFVWNAVINMMYSDYYKVAQKYGQDNPTFYSDLAKAFLYDDDANDSDTKVARYYHEVFMW